MMVKYKVSDLAKDFSMQSKDIVAILTSELESTKKTSSTLEEAELDVIFDVLTKKHEVKSFDAYFATGAKAREAAAAERKAEKDRKLAEQMAILEQMKAAAAELRFEEAAFLRDKIRTLETTKEDKRKMKNE